MNNRILRGQNKPETDLRLTLTIKHYGNLRLTLTIKHYGNI